MLLLTGVCVYGGIVDAEHSAANAPLWTWCANQITQEKADLRHTKCLHRYVGLTTSWGVKSVYFFPNQTTSNFSPIKFLYGSGVRGLRYLPIMYFKFFVFESSVVPLCGSRCPLMGLPIHHRHNNVLAYDWTFSYQWELFIFWKDGSKYQVAITLLKKSRCLHGYAIPCFSEATSHFLQLVEPHSPPQGHKMKVFCVGMAAHIRERLVCRDAKWLPAL